MRILIILLSLIANSITAQAAVNDSAPADYWFNRPEFQKLLDEQTHSKAYEKNQVKLLVNGAASYAQRKINIKSANVILIKTFEFLDDEIGNEIVDLLLEKAKQGAKVFVQYDVKGNYDTYSDLSKIVRGKKNPIPPHLQRFVKGSQGNGFLIPTSIPFSLFETLPFYHVPNNHEKYLITWDYKGPVKVIMGGLNTSAHDALSGAKDAHGNPIPVPFYISKGFKGVEALAFRDTDVEVIGTVTQDIVKEYIRSAEYHLNNQNIYFKKHILASVQKAIEELKKVQESMIANAASAFPENVGTAFVRFIATPPHQDDKEWNIVRMLVLMMQNIPKGSTVWMTASQIVPTPEIQNALLAAAKRGVKFEILGNPTVGADPVLTNIAMATRCRFRHLLTQFPKDSVSFYEWQGNYVEGVGRLMHQKIDAFGADENAPFSVGSSNLDAHSLKWNSEDLLLIQSRELKKEFNAILKHDFSEPNSRKVTEEQLKKDDLIDKFHQCLFDWVFHSVI